MTSDHGSTLVIKLGALGDMVQAIPMFDVLRQRYGDHLTLLTTAPFVGFAQRSGYFKAIICDDRASLKTNVNVLLRLRKSHFTRIVDLQNVDRTRLYKCVLLGSYGQWIADPYKQKHVHPHARFTALCAAQKWQTLPLVDIKAMAEPFVDVLPSPYMMIIAGASNAHGGRKRWPQAAYADLCVRLQRVGITPVLIGSRSDDLAELEAACAGAGAINLIGKTTLFQLITIAQNAIGAVGNDTGPQLIVAASGCLTITLFSAVNPPCKGGAWPWDKVRHRTVYADDLATLSVDAVWDALQPLCTIHFR
ncbi:MAG: glycosyltransferase family 9 protein [Pseudomonadota bacterium]